MQPVPNDAALSLTPINQIRLAKLSVFNWGSFHGLHTANIDAKGTLITGDNGSGKSTLVDGLMALLMPAGRAAFNVAAAQNDKSDRSLMSYMRGSFGSAHDGISTKIKSKRDKGVITGLSAEYLSDDGQSMTLLALFWTTAASQSLSDVKRLYIVAQKQLLLSEVLEQFGQANVRTFKHWLGSQPEVTCCDDNFSNYQELYRRMLYMDNPNAPALLARALGLKKIDDLTELIRKLVLEPSGVREDAKDIVQEFDDLVAIHTRLQDAKEQVSHLERLPLLNDSVVKTKAIIEDTLSQKQALPIYFAKRYAALYQEQQQHLTQELAQLERQLDRIKTLERDASDKVNRFRDAYLKLGGNRIEDLKKDIQNTHDTLTRTNETASRYQKLCRKLNIDTTLNDTVFHKNIAQADDSQAYLTEQEVIHEQNFNACAITSNETQTAHQALTDEIAALKNQPNSNIPPKFNQLKNNICQSLDIQSDELMFIGELIDLKDDEKHWQGAIERALGGLKTTLLVPNDRYSLITKWLNSQHTGLHVRVQVVSLNNKTSDHTDFKPDGFLHKLQWRTHPYRDWLKHFLNRHDLICAKNVAQLDSTPYSMTQQGLIHKQQGRFDKKDLQRIDDSRHWQLGFSNKNKLALLQAEAETLKTKLLEDNQRWQDARSTMRDASAQISLWNQLKGFDWSQLDVPYWQKKLAQEKKELDAIDNAQGDLKQAKIHFDDATQALAKISDEKADQIRQNGAKEQELTTLKKELDRYSQLIKTPIDAQVEQQLAALVGHIERDDATYQTQITRKLDDNLSKHQSKLSKYTNTAVGIMSGYKSKPQWQAYTVEWASGIDGIEDYITHLNQLNDEGLPELLDVFKKRLNKHATQSLARLSNHLSTVHDDIRRRIGHINEVLKKTDFRQHSHLKLGLKRESFVYVQAFNQKLNQALGALNDENHEKRFYLLKDVIDILDKATRSSSQTTLESLRLLDPRYQLTFFAEEIDNDTHEVLDVLSSSSGKSGGEKESFAGMIVAASLAYVLTPDGCNMPIYSTVFLDEAFSNTAEQVSRRVLKVFKTLNIHVNLITPFKNLNLARDSAKSLLIAERDIDHHESRLCEVTWQEVDDIMASNESAQTDDQELASLGVQILD